MTYRAGQPGTRCLEEPLPGARRADPAERAMPTPPDRKGQEDAAQGRGAVGPAEQVRPRSAATTRSWRGASSSCA